MSGIEFPFPRNEEQIKDLMLWAKTRWDEKHFGSTHPLIKATLLADWYLFQYRTIQPLVDELNAIEDWRRRTAGRVGNSRPLALHK